MGRIKQMKNYPIYLGHIGENKSTDRYFYQILGLRSYIRIDTSNSSMSIEKYQLSDKRTILQEFSSDEKEFKIRRGEYYEIPESVFLENKNYVLARFANPSNGEKLKSSLDTVQLINDFEEVLKSLDEHTSKTRIKMLDKLKLKYL